MGAREVHAQLAVEMLERIAAHAAPRNVLPITEPGAWLNGRR